MSNIVDRVFAEVCLDERISDGIFRMDEEEHMDALRDYFIKKGITKEAAVNVTNRMVEGRFPERQAWRKEDGILVTWPSPQHKAKAMRENPGKYVEQDPRPKAQRPQEPEKRPERPERPEKEEPGDKEKILPKSTEPSTKEGPKVTQGDKELEVEPPRGEEKPEPPPVPSAPPVQQAPRTPERIAAEKEVVKQIIQTDDSNLTKLEPNPTWDQSPEAEAKRQAELRNQLTELYKKADELGFREAVKFLTPHVKS